MTSLLDTAARGRNAAWRYGLATALALLLASVLGTVLIIALMIVGLSPLELTTELQQPSRPAAFFLANGIIFGILLLSFAAVIRIVHKKRFANVTGGWSWRLAARGAAIWFCVQLALALLDLAIAPGGFRITAAPATGALALAATFALSIQTFAEEFVFRGYVTQGLLLATRRPLVAATLSGLLFGSLHIPNGAPQAIGAVAFGVATALVTIRTGNIAFSWGLHLVNNLFGAVVVVSAADVFKGSPGLITQDTPQLLWWDLATATLALAGVAWWVWRPGARPRPPGRQPASAN